MQWKSLARHSIRHLIELGTSNANTPAGSEETIGVGARVRLIHSDDPYTKLGLALRSLGVDQAAAPVVM